MDLIWCDYILPTATPIASATFEREPPLNLRKSTFFNFSIRLFDAEKRPIGFEEASFASFLENDARNGVHYMLSLVMENEKRQQADLFIYLVDSKTEEMVRFEGSARDTQLQRVLITHMALCSRCSEGKICGNKSETPSSPVILENYLLKFYLKCNQNCVRGAGNPKNSRRFRLVVAANPGPKPDFLAVSRDIFVHNNSKHAKPKDNGRVREEPEEGRGEPTVVAISPSEGWTIGGQTIVIIGKNLQPGIQVMFGERAVASQFINRHAIRAQTPPHPGPGQVKISLSLGGQHIKCSNPGKFTYLAQCLPSLDYEIARLARLVPRLQGDPARLPRELILRRAAEMVEAIFYSRSIGSVVNEGRELLLTPWQEKAAACQSKEKTF